MQAAQAGCLLFNLAVCTHLYRAMMGLALAARPGPAAYIPTMHMRMNIETFEGCPGKSPETGCLFPHLKGTYAQL